MIIIPFGYCVVDLPQLFLYLTCESVIFQGLSVLMITYISSRDEKSFLNTDVSRIWAPFLA